MRQHKDNIKMKNREIKSCYTYGLELRSKDI